MAHPALQDECRYKTNVDRRHSVFGYQIKHVVDFWGDAAALDHLSRAVRLLTN